LDATSSQNNTEDHEENGEVRPKATMQIEGALVVERHAGRQNQLHAWIDRPAVCTARYSPWQQSVKRFG
jgi:hypothetical protein